MPGHLVFGGPRSRNKRGFTKMALTWATGVIVRAKKTLISISFFPFLCFFKYFGHFVFGLVFGPLSFLGPFRISVLIYMSL
ncbi:hypothetical protein Hanom_Chr04g00383931 [Helianthus anomalus]